MESIRYRILGPVSIAFLFFLGLAIFGIYWLQKSHIENNIQSSLNRLQKSFDQEISEEAELLAGLLDFIEKDPRLQKAWLAKDRDKLLNLALPLFQDIHSKYRVTHFYFIGLDKVCFLRVHNSPRFGDTIERHTLGQAVMEKKQVHGVELGKFGTLTLRRVHPWRVDGKLIGYLEIGEEVEHITQELSDILSLELIFTVDKHQLKRSQWEEGLKMLNRAGDWDQFPDFVVIDSTTDKIFPALGEYMQDHEFHVPHNSSGALGKLEIFGNQETWKGGIVPLIDARNHEIGHIISLQDITIEKSSLRTLLVTLLGLGGMIVAVLVAVYSRYIGGIEKRLIAGRLGLVKEIDERKQAEQALRKSEGRIRTLFENIPQKIFYKDRQSVYISCNENYARDHEIKPEEIVGKSDYDFFPKELAEKYRADDKEIMESGATRWIEEKYICRGIESLVQTVKTPVCDDQGNAIGVLGIFEDITERKKTEEEVRKLSRAVEQSPGIVMITDTEGRIEYVNPTFIRTTGYSLEEVLGKNPRILKSGETPAGEYKKLWETITSGKEWRGEFHNKKKNGELYWEYATISPIADGEGKTTHFIALKEDITEKKQSDEKLKLAQKSIQASEKLSGIGRLAAGVSHEILNPLNIISIHTQMLLESKKDDQSIQKSLVKIQNEIKRIEKINKSLLTFSRKGTPQSREINIAQELETVLDLVEKDLSLDNIEVVREFPTRKVEVKADPDELRQVFLNILQNARHAMSSSGTLSLQVENVQIDGLGYGRIRLSDTGCGISKENLKNIFEPFFTTKPEGEGTGMGLSVCHTLIEKNGGTIHVESEEGKGTTFFIDLPLFEAEEDND